MTIGERSEHIQAEPFFSLNKQWWAGTCATKHPSGKYELNIINSNDSEAVLCTRSKLGHKINWHCRTLIVIKCIQSANKTPQYPVTKGQLTFSVLGT